MLRKTTFDNSIKYCSKHNNSQSDFKPKPTSLPKKQNKKLSKLILKNHQRLHNKSRTWLLK